MKIKSGDREIEIEVSSIKGFKKIRGLMFSRGEENLLFEFRKPVNYSLHSWFCPNFLAIWLNKDNKVVDLRLIKKNKISIKSSSVFSKLIEIPINKSNYNLIKSLVDSFSIRKV